MKTCKDFDIKQCIFCNCILTKICPFFRIINCEIQEYREKIDNMNEGQVRNYIVSVIRYGPWIDGTGDTNPIWTPEWSLQYLIFVLQEFYPKYYDLYRKMLVLK